METRWSSAREEYLYTVHALKRDARVCSSITAGARELFNGRRAALTVFNERDRRLCSFERRCRMALNGDTQFIREDVSAVIE